MATNLILWVPGMTQDLIDFAWSNFRKISQYNAKLYIHPLPLFPRIILCHLVAIAENLTLVEIPTYFFTTLDNPIIYPHLSFTTGLKTLWQTQQRFCNRKKDGCKLLEFVQVEPLDDNFLYCDSRKKEGESVLSFFTLISCFDKATWCCIIVTLITQNLYMKATKHFSYFDCKYAKKKYFIKPTRRPDKHEFCEQMILLIFSVFLLNLYSSLITGTMIIPPEDEAFVSITDFSKNELKVNLLVNKEFEFTIDKYRNISLTPHDHRTAEIIYVAKLLPNLSYATYLNYFSKMIEHTEYIFVSVFEWHWAIQFSTVLNKEIFSEGQERTKRCFLGGKLIETGNPRYFGVYDTTSSKIKSRFEALVEGGIYSRWEQESTAWTSALRMQDRFRILSKTKVRDGFESSPFYSLKMEGHVLKPFILFAICLVICTSCFVLEIIKFKLRHYYNQ